MFTRADIRKVSIAVTEQDYSSVIVSLGQSGLVHIDSYVTDKDVSSLGGGGNAPLSVDITAAERILASAGEFLSETSYRFDTQDYFQSSPPDLSVLFTGNIESDLYYAEKIKNKTEQYARTRRAILNSMKCLETKLREIRRMGDCSFDPVKLRDMEYISYIYGRSGNSSLLKDVDEKVFYITTGDYMLALFPPELKGVLLNSPACEDFEDLDYMVGPGRSLEQEEAAAENRMNELRQRLDRVDSFYGRELPLWEEKIRNLAALYSALLKISRAEGKLLFLNEIVIINGWIRADDSDKLRNLLAELCGKGFYFKTGSRVESRRLRDIVPVLLKNNPLLRPFELLVKMMGVPGNSEVDPTPAAAIAYMITFGVMFGDVGQGLVLALAGLVINRYGKSRYRARNNVSDFGGIMAWCGISAVVFGFLYGSFFSNEHILPALLFHPMENMMELLLMAVMMGAFFITTGLFLNSVNGLIAGHYGESLFGPKGAAGLGIYAVFIFFAMRFILQGKTPEVFEIFMALVVPALLFFFRGPLDFFLFHGEHPFPRGPFEYIVETLIEVIEMFSGFLGNTISYIRAGAFALSHAGLSMAVYTLAEMIGPSITGMGAITVIVIGNIFIILLEGLVCAIQSMRLEYYEFFGKFYRGNGTEFVPFLLEFKHAKMED